MNTVWSKTILSVYTRLESITEDIDSFIFKLGMAEKRPCRFGTRDVFDNIIAMSEKKIKYINLKVLTDKILNGLKPEHSAILEDHFFKHFNTRELTFSQGVSQRTMFRRLNTAIEEFTFCLRTYGYTDEVLDKKFEKDFFIMEEKRIIEQRYNYVLSREDKHLMFVEAQFMNKGEREEYRDEGC